MLEFIKKLYWFVAIVAFILAAYYAPKMVDYEWGLGAYIAVAWGIFISIMGIVAAFAPNIKKYLDSKEK